MDIKQAKEDQSPNWKYLPDTDTLLQYLNRADLIELSKCCKFYRKKLEPEVLKKLTLSVWKIKNLDSYFELRDSKNYKKLLKFMKIDLGTKLKLAKKFTLDCDINYHFAKKFIKLLPNINILSLYENCNHYCSWERGLIAILKGMKHLEYVEFNYYWAQLESYYHKKEIFPKSLKSLKVCNNRAYYNYEVNMSIYDTIDSKYTNLNSLSIASNRMLQNLATRIPSLQKVSVLNINTLDKLELIAFIKANFQLKTLDISVDQLNEELIKTILSSKSLECLHIGYAQWKEEEINILTSSYSIKHIIINNYIPVSLVIRLVNSCKHLETLEFKHYSDISNLVWSKLEQRINILKLTYFNLTPNCFKKIDSSRLFNQVRLKLRISIEKFIERFNMDKLENYNFIPLVSGSCILKLTNK